MDNIVRLKRSSVFGKAPLPSQIEVGELCLNFNSSNPFLSFKDSENEIQKFLSENKVRNLIADVKNDVDASFYTKAQINQMFEDLESGGTIEFDDYYTKIESDAKYQTLSGMSSYLTVASAEGLYQPKGDYALKSELPDLTDYALKSEIPDVSDFVTSAFTEATYAKKDEVPSIDTYTKSEADEKFQAQSGMTDYALKSELPDTSNFAEKSEIPDVSNFITSAFTEETYSKLGHTHSYNDLQDKPTIPSIEGLASLSDLANYQPISGMSSYLTVASAESTYQPKGDYALVSQIPSVEGFVTSAYTEATYMKIGDVPTDVYTKSETDTLLAGKASSSHTHTASEIVDLDVPKIWKGTLSEYTNLTEIDSDTLYVITDESEQFVTSGDVESMISGYTTLSEVEVLLGGFSPTGHTHVMSDITDLDIPSIEGLASEAWVGANFQPQSAMTGYSESNHTHDYSEIENTPDLTGFATKQELANYQPQSGMTSYLTIAQAEQDLQPKGDYALQSQIPDTSNFITSGYTEDRYQPKGTYVVPSDLNDYALKSELPSIEGLATEAELANYQPVSSMTDYALVSQIPSTTGLASETWVSQNFQPQSGMSEYSTTGHTHSQYLTQTSADSRYARVVSCTQAEYDALVQNDQVEQGVLYCITESNS